jgi:hypothetical protein
MKQTLFTYCSLLTFVSSSSELDKSRSFLDLNLISVALYPLVALLCIRLMKVLAAILGKGSKYFLIFVKESKTFSCGESAGVRFLVTDEISP